MDAKVTLPYGDGEITIDIKNAASIQQIDPNPMEEIADLKDAFIHSVEDKAYSVTLKEAVQADDQVTIVVSDITRSWMHQGKVIPLLVEYLHDEIGLPYENMVILIATGTHRPSTPEEHVELCSQEVVDHVRIVDHDCDADDLVYVGTTSRGTKVCVNPLLVGRKVIVVGGTIHHVLAGFGGGRKNILPGCSSRETIKENHERSLDPYEFKTDDKVGPRKLKDNQIHEDMEEAAHFVNPVFGINLVVASSGNHSGIFSGDMDESWLASTKFVSDSYEVPVPEKADILLCSTGGYPKDINLYQGCKGMLNTIDALKEGGTLFWACECREGGGQAEYFDWLKPLQEGCFEEALRGGFTIDGYIFFRTVEAASKADHAYLLSKLDPELIKPMGMETSDDPEELLSKIDFTDKTVYVVPYGGYVVPI